MSQLNIPHRPPMVPSKALGNGGPQKQLGLKRRFNSVNDGPGDDGADPNISDPNDQGNNGSGGDDINDGHQQNDNDGNGDNGGNDLPVDQPILRNRNQGNNNQQRGNNGGNNNGNRRGPAASGYANNGNNGGNTGNNYRNGMRGQQQQNQQQMNDDEGLAEPAEVLPTDPAELKKALDRIESKRKTEVLRKKCQPTAPTVVNVAARRAPPAIKLSQLNPDLCGLGNDVKKSADPKQAMIFGNHTYAGLPGPTIQVDGRLTATPMVSATFDTTNFTIELLDPVEQKNWSGMSRVFKRNFVKMAVEKKWSFACTMINKMVFRDFFLRGKIMDQAMREKYADPDLLPIDMVDPETKQVIECYPPRIKAQLVMSKKNRNELETDVMDEHDVQMNPYDLRRGNMVRLAIKLSYFYYKTILNSTMPNEYGLPCKLAMVKRLDKEEATDGGPLKRTKWAEEEPLPTTQLPPLASAPILTPAALVAAMPVPTAPETAKAVDANSVLGAAAAALSDKVKEQVAASVVPTKSPPPPPAVTVPKSASAASTLIPVESAKKSDAKPVEAPKVPNDKPKA